MDDELRDDLEPELSELPGEDENEEDDTLDRRGLLSLFKKWSKIVIAGIVVGTNLAESEEAQALTGWVNRRGGGSGGWVNRRGGGGGVWANRSGGGGWANRIGGGGWVNRSGGGWVNRRGGGGWLNRR